MCECPLSFAFFLPASSNTYIRYLKIQMYSEIYAALEMLLCPSRLLCYDAVLHYSVVYYIVILHCSVCRILHLLELQKDCDVYTRATKQVSRMLCLKVPDQ